MTNTHPKNRITDEMLNQIIGDGNPAELFHSGELMAELRQKWAERILAAEMDHHLAQSEEQESGNVRNGHSTKTVLTESDSMPLIAEWLSP